MKAKKIKTDKIKKDNEFCKNDPRYKAITHKSGNHKKAAKAELLFYNKCKELGYCIELLCYRAIDIKVNGYLIDIKSCYTFKKIGKNKLFYATFNISKYQKKNSNFIACYHAGRDSFFIIPTDNFPTNSNGGIIYIPIKPSVHESVKNKYEPYLEAWHLLKAQINGG